MDDYYSLLGIDADASVDDIRGAYRVRKDSLDTSNDAGKADAARLNKAWNVLSDPYQRGRYDEQRTRASADGTLADEPTIAVTNGARSSTAGLTPRQQRAQAARDARRARVNQKPTIEPPAGTHYPVARRRVVAMVIDLLVLIVLFAGSQVLMVSLEKSQHRAVYDARQQLVNHTIPDAQKQTSADNSKLNDAKKANNAADQKTYGDKVTADKNHETDLNKQLDILNGKLSHVENAVTAGFFLVGLLYLVVPSMLTGRTLGKRFQRLRVVRENGTPLGIGALVRYGSIVFAAYVLSFVVGPLAAVLVLFGITLWMRNPNMQGLHDRFAHTIVVADNAD